MLFDRILASPPQIIAATSLSQTISAELQRCPSDVYVIVSQPSVRTTDYSGRHSPHLRKWVSGEDKRIRSSFTVTDVLGHMDTSEFVELLEKQCDAGTLDVDASSEFSYGVWSVAHTESLCPVSSILDH